MESSRPKKIRKTKEHITPGNGDRHEKNEQELDGTRKEGPGQSGLESAGRWPMLHWEKEALPLPTRTFACASNPPCLSTVLLRYAGVSISFRVSPSSVICLTLSVLYYKIMLCFLCMLSCYTEYLYLHLLLCM
ncbi:unnamed protein product [Schistosoma margrebowiei]|uniref:Uncharacterized protein n=1 Tax=Schistosoma margrebowiei TaxID=48269 RepID=A0A183MBH7_9TREM|nr:unnamed protein product [Schistosoma margrebowiei]